MTGINKNSPLSSAQREKAGSQTFGKYNYQYHWALFRILSEHDNVREYAVFVELHEDVVLANSLNSDIATFEFNQIKTNNKAFTAKSLTSLKNNSSVLGKLVTNKSNVLFGSKITDLNLVACKGFSLTLKEPDLELNIIRLDDLADDEHTKLTECLKKELGLEKLPAELTFKVSQLSEKQFQQIIIGELSNLISRLYPNSSYASANIYQILIDELQKKGAVSIDYTKWQDVLDQKALTSNTVQQVIETFTSTKNETIISQGIADICRELTLTSMQSVELKREFDRYRQNKFKNKNATQIDVSNEITSLINDHKNTCEGKFAILIDLVKNNLTSKCRSHFATEDQINGAIMCEYLTQ